MKNTFLTKEVWKRKSRRVVKPQVLRRDEKHWYGAVGKPGDASGLYPEILKDEGSEGRTAFCSASLFRSSRNAAGVRRAWPLCFCDGINNHGDLKSSLIGRLCAAGLMMGLVPAPDATWGQRMSPFARPSLFSQSWLLLEGVNTARWLLQQEDVLWAS